MEQNRNSYQVWWVYDQPISADTTVVVPLGCNVSAAFAPAGNGVGLVRDLRYFAFNFFGTYGATTLSLRAEVGNVAGAMKVWWTHAHSASNNVDSIHNVAAPYGNAQGIMGLATQYLRLKIIVGAGANVTALSFMARAWKE